MTDKEKSILLAIIIGAIALFVILFIFALFIGYKDYISRETIISQMKYQNKVWMNSNQMVILYGDMRDKIEGIIDDEIEVINQVPDDGCLSRPIPSDIKRVLTNSPYDRATK